MFKPVYPFRDKMPVYHYPMPLEEPSSEILDGKHLQLSSELHTYNNNLYIHLPFCKSICSFCPFTKWVGDQKKLTNYLEHLYKEIEMYAQKDFVKNIQFSAVYFGGGTPSFFSANELVELLLLIKNSFNISDDAEITVEGSPSSFSKEKFEALKVNGVTRISMGAQTLNPNFSKIMGLLQEPERTKAITKAAINCNFNAVSLDLIYNIPGQSLEDWINDLEQTIALGINQLTLFPLTVIPFTKIGQQIKSGELPEILPQEQEFKYYYEASKLLQKHGFYQLTNVDWIKPGTEYKYCAQHFFGLANIMGIGAGAFGEMNGVSYINSGNLEEYFSSVSASEFPIKKCAATENELLYQYITMGLRGLKLSDFDFQNRFGISMFEMFQKQFFEASNKGLLKILDSEVEITPLGAFYLYDLSKEFVSDKYSQIKPFASSIEKISKG